MAHLSLINLAGGSWLAPGPTNVGAYVDGCSAWLVDSGNDKEAGRQILRALGEKGWKLAGVVNTHSNADHIGANDYLQRATGCEIWASAGEAPYIERPSLEGIMLWGGFPPKDLRSKFFEAKPSKVTRIVGPADSDGRFTFIPLPGHFVDMIGVLTADGALYLGDSLFGVNILEKHKIPFIYDVAAFRASLETLRGIDAKFFVPSHGEVRDSAAALVEANAAAADRIEDVIRRVIASPRTFEEILAGLCASLGVALDCGQYALAGSTVRSFLAYLRDADAAEFAFEGDKMFWTARS